MARVKTVSDASAAYAKIVAASPLSSREHVDALLDALLAAYPDASLLEAVSWLSGVAPGDRGITRGNTPA